MNFKRKLLLLLISFSIIMPFNAMAYSKYLIPGGENVGITIHTKGVFVVGFYSVNGKSIAENAGLKVGDRIVSINDEEVSNTSDLVKKINSNEDNISVKIGYVRNNKTSYLTLNLKRESDGTYKTGIYVKDTITGIGTLTYIDPTSNAFGALGHEVVDSSSNVNFTLKDGEVFKSDITSITKSTIGTPGEKNATLEPKNIYGDIKYNLKTGIFGKLNEKISNSEPLMVASMDEVELGKAEIITVIDGNKKETFDIEIISIDKKNDTKNFLVKVTDEGLINKTGGIVKGMSGSPIIQNGKIIGAITHTIVDKPTKGYGISIIKMLESVD